MAKAVLLTLALFDGATVALDEGGVIAEMEATLYNSTPHPNPDIQAARLSERKKGVYERRWTTRAGLVIELHATREGPANDGKDVTRRIIQGWSISAKGAKAPIVIGRSWPQALRLAREAIAAGVEEAAPAA